MIEIVKATPEEMLALWNGRFAAFVDKTLAQIAAGTLENYQIREDGVAFGELSIAWKDDDPDEANGVDTATLQGFRIDKAHEGHGYGGMLVRRLLQIVKERGYAYCTIGADDRDGERLRAMYRHLGFTETVKESKFSYVEDGQTHLDTYVLLRQKL